MSELHGQKRKADEESIEGPSEEPTAKLAHNPIEDPSVSSDDRNPFPPPPSVKNEKYLRLDLLEMTNIPKYWNAVLNIGSGAFGEVRLVHSDRIDARGENIIHNEFALKIVKFPSSHLVNVVREVEMHRRCRDHGNVLFAGLSYCQPLDEGYRVQMCLEYAAMSDMTLLALREKKECHVAYVCKEVLTGLQYIHSLGIVHGDISLKNVLMTHQGVIKLSDFGMADTFENTKRTGKEFIGGTPGFIAPEVIQMQGYDTKADMWSVGTFAVFLFSGRNPFKQGLLFDIQTYRRLILEKYYPDLKDFGISIVFRRFMNDMNNYNPLNRSDASDMLKKSFIQEKCTRQELLAHYKHLRSLHGMDLPYPDETQEFTVPVTKE